MEQTRHELVEKHFLREDEHRIIAAFVFFSKLVTAIDVKTLLTFFILVAVFTLLNVFLFSKCFIITIFCIVCYTLFKIDGQCNMVKL